MKNVLRPLLIVGSAIIAGLVAVSSTIQYLIDEDSEAKPQKGVEREDKKRIVVQGYLVDEREDKDEHE